MSKNSKFHDAEIIGLLYDKNKSDLLVLLNHVSTPISFNGRYRMGIKFI